MLDYIKGSVAELSPASAVVEAHGLGYRVNITLATYGSLQAAGGGEVRVYVHEVLRDEAHELYGFASVRERELFGLLIGVSGVGPGTARTVLSSASVQELEQAIASGDAQALRAVKGVGAKTAERIIVDLRDKIKAGGEALIEGAGAAAGQVLAEAQAALVMLGYSPQQSARALRRLLGQQPGLTAEQAIKQALKMM